MAGLKAYPAHEYRYKRTGLENLQQALFDEQTAPHVRRDTRRTFPLCS
jgi:hypothetical protein